MSKIKKTNVIGQITQQPNEIFSHLVSSRQTRNCRRRMRRATVAEIPNEKLVVVATRRLKTKYDTSI
jgi:hypothetical protein